MPALSDAQVSATPAPAAAPAAPAPEIPSPFVDVVSGAVPGVTIEPIVGGKTNDLQEFVVQNFMDLQSAGLEYTELPDLRSVFYNPKSISEKDILAAAEAGQLEALAPVALELGQPPAPPAAAAPAAQALQGAPAPAAAPQTAPSGALAGVSASPRVPTDRKLEQARLQNMAQNKTPPKSGPLAALQRRAV